MTSILPGPSAAMPGEARSPLSTTHPFTCNTCQVAFRSSDQQRTHMHTDWHRYNLKRRITSLPPLSSEVFAEKVLHMQATSKLERERAAFEKQCKACNRTYYSENAFANHLGSQKHKQNAAAGIAKAAASTRVATGDQDEVRSVADSTFSFGEPVQDENKHGNVVKVEPTVAEENEEATIAASSVANIEFANVVSKLKLSASDDKTSPSSVDQETLKSPSTGPQVQVKPLPVTTCIFCNYDSPSLHLNVAHMSKTHGLFIPEQQYLVDLEGLIKYLGEKVAIGNQCLYCRKVKGGLEGIQTHMRDKGHCKVAFEVEDQQLELGDFYDFRATYDDDEDSEEEEIQEGAFRLRKRGGIKPNKPAKEIGFKSEGGEEDGEGWETDSDASSLDSQELTAVPLDRCHSSDSGDRPKHHKEDGWHSRAHSHAHPHAKIIYHDDYELHLPSGRSVGHRSLARYYRQNLSHPLSARVGAISHTRYPGSSLREHGEFNTLSEGVEEVEGFAGEDGETIEEDDIQLNELTRREKRDLMFRQRGEDRIIRRTLERGSGTLTTRGRAGLLGVGKATQRQVVEEEKRGRKAVQRAEKEYQWVLEKRANCQKHYRDPVLQ